MKSAGWLWCHHPEHTVTLQWRLWKIGELQENLHLTPHPTLAGLDHQRQTHPWKSIWSCKKMEERGCNWKRYNKEIGEQRKTKAESLSKWHASNWAHFKSGTTDCIRIGFSVVLAFVSTTLTLMHYPADGCIIPAHTLSFKKMVYVPCVAAFLELDGGDRYLKWMSDQCKCHSNPPPGAQSLSGFLESYQATQAEDSLLLPQPFRVSRQRRMQKD